jgi:hypothetical protein
MLPPMEDINPTAAFDAEVREHLPQDVCNFSRHTPTRYSRPEFLNTSETIEFILDFSAGAIAGG